MKGAIMATSNTKSTDLDVNPETGEVNDTDLQELAQVVSPDGAAQTIASLSGGKATVVSSFEGADHATLIKVAAAVGNAEKLSENLDKVINLRHYVAQQTEVESLTNKGQMETVVRVVLVDDDGSAYAAISVGIAKSLENLVGIVGMPATWPSYIPIKVVERVGKRGKYFTILYV